MGNKPAALIDRTMLEILNVVKKSVKRGMDIDTQDSGSNAPLIIAAKEGNLDVVQYLVEQGADIDIQDNGGNTALIDAARHGRLKMVRYLVEQGADIEKHNSNGDTALSWAVWKHDLEVVEYLLEQGADKDKQNNYGNTPLIEAAIIGTLQVVRHLVEQGADMEKHNREGYTALLSAATYANFEVVRYLVESGADGQTAMLWAAKSLPMNRSLQVLKRLVQPVDNRTCIDENGNTVLLLLLSSPDISEEDLLPVAKLLLQHGTPPLLCNNEGKSARSLAQRKGFSHIAALVNEHATKSRDEPETEEDPQWFISRNDVARDDVPMAVGGFGMVYRAKWANNDVVVKEVSVVERQRFLKEVDIWDKLRHANIVTFYGANHQKQPYRIFVVVGVAES